MYVIYLLKDNSIDRPCVWALQYRAPKAPKAALPTLKDTNPDCFRSNEGTRLFAVLTGFCNVCVCGGLCRLVGDVIQVGDSGFAVKRNCVECQ